MWLERLRALLRDIGEKSWIYREGKTRNVYVLETASKKLSMNFDPTLFASNAEKIAYICGYFDAEGGVAHYNSVRFYLQLAEKNKRHLEKVKNLLEGLGIKCGVVHNPSKRVDPNYWRFFIRAQSYKEFIEKVGSWHPRKQNLLSNWMKI